MGFNFIASLGTFGGGVITYAIPFLFVLTIVVFFHELGHFLVARWCGVRILAFSIGFGPELIGFNDRHGTRWKVAAIPLGGYVKFFGDENVASVPDTAAVAAMNDAEKNESFFHKNIPARAAIVAAGPIANFLLAIVIFAGIFMLYGKQSTTARVDSVEAGSAAAAAGFLPGDLVISIDGRAISDFDDMKREVAANAGNNLEFVVERDGNRITLHATPALKKDPFGNRIGLLGIARSMAPSQPVGPIAAVALGAEHTWLIIDQTMSSIGKMVMGRGSVDQFGGPGRIAQISGQVWKSGLDSGGISGAFVALLQLAGVLSVSIGLLNLFPIPLLDGGHLLFYAIEAVRGRPLSDRAQEVGFRIGLAFVIMLMIFATFNDILHFTSS
jgi:regulator of sigma E protease